MAVLQARNITLRDLRIKFNLQLVEDQQFFREWQDDLPEVSDAEKRQLDRVKANFSNLLEYPPLLENTVKMVVLSPLLDLANFYLSPLHVKSEPSISIESEDGDTIVKGEIDVLVLFERLWILVIESKKVDYSLEVARSQALAYMLASPNLDQPIFGLITNGVDFKFLKLVKQPQSQYAMSKIFNLFDPNNGLYQALSILKRLGQISQGG